ncbi:MAG TPA: hypothetical protein VF742_13140 [Terracidiphilus sp.]
MATFPALNTGAVAQYPLGFGVRYATQAVWFLDGTQQKYRLIGTGLRRWTLKLDLLQEDELGAVIAFVEQQGGAPFTFTDPLTGAGVPNCVLCGEQFDATIGPALNGQTTVVIEEIG